MAMYKDYNIHAQQMEARLGANQAGCRSGNGEFTVTPKVITLSWSLDSYR